MIANAYRKEIFMNWIKQKLKISSLLVALIASINSCDSKYEQENSTITSTEDKFNNDLNTIPMPNIESIIPNNTQDDYFYDE